ncbi:hypothetical protein [Microbacterium sp. KR10-403]|uniref:hypothetical protein n=1 Tax=Microbacterium sp. KR10-403 TaxID=3158581 RepID=UPI0032E38514
MAEQTGSTTATDGTDSQQQGEPKEFEAITSQADFDKAIQARIARERAKFADYDQLKAKAQQVDQAAQAAKTAEEKNADRLAKLEGDLEAERLGRVRAEVAAEKKVPAGLLTGATREELEAAADALVQFKGEQPRMGVVPGEGKQPAQKKTTADLFAEAIGDAL